MQCCELLVSGTRSASALFQFAAVNPIAAGAETLALAGLTKMPVPVLFFFTFNFELSIEDPDRVGTVNFFNSRR
jgi:hypothetical protein